VTRIALDVHHAVKDNSDREAVQAAKIRSVPIAVPAAQVSTRLEIVAQTTILSALLVHRVQREPTSQEGV